MTYSEKLRDPRWQKKRLEVFNRDNWTCLKCKRNDITLNVHHKKYTGNPWDAPNEDLETICELCHEKEHNIDNCTSKTPEVMEISRTAFYPMHWRNNPEILSLCDEIYLTKESLKHIDYKDVNNESTPILYKIMELEKRRYVLSETAKINMYGN